MQFTTSPPDVIRSVRQRWLLGEWNRLRRTRPMPASKDLVVEDLSRMVDSLMFCDIVAGSGDIRFLIRYRGQRILETYGECDGKHLDDTLPAISRDATLSAYRHVVAIGQPVYTVAQTRDRAGKPVDFERLLLPFSRDGGETDRILSALEWVSIEGGFDSRALLRTQTAAPAYMVCASIEPSEQAYPTDFEPLT